MTFKCLTWRRIKNLVTCITSILLCVIITMSCFLWLLSDLVNALSQTSHLKGVWTLLYLVRSQFWLNFLSQTSHLKGVSPVWILLYHVRSQFWLNFLSQFVKPFECDVCDSQTSHSNGFSPVWVLLWIVNCPARLNFLSQTSHWKGFSPVWTI